ncbi:MAG: response regulator [Gammaproteobacteria bacterium]|nr:response regulator [Gammaproteobacteria bacterium]
MPDMDGYEVVRRIRQESAPQEIVVIALSGWGQKEDHRRASEAGFDYHLVKPVDPRILEEVLAQAAAREPATS